MKQATRINHYPETGTTTVMTQEQASACDVVELNPERNHRESLSEAFCEEIDQWARRALAANGFGGY